MRKLFKTSSFLLYFLSILTFFLLGATFAGLTDVAKGQDLAGGAIVFMYGITFASIAFVGSLLLAYYAKHKVVITANRILGIVLTIAILIITYRFINREEKLETPHRNIPKKTTTPAVLESNIFSFSSVFTKQEIDKPKMGLGFFKPNFYKDSVLYFYRNPNFGKSIHEHTPSDSIVFQRVEQGSFDITYAPPWLQPEHLKLDYDILYFKIQSIGSEFIEITVNSTNQKTTYVSRRTGEVIYWQDFLLNVFSVEFINGNEQTIRYKPFHSAGEVNTKFEFMIPLRIKNNWMLVNLIDYDHKVVGKGWIQWKKDGELIIDYSLLS
ncbi:MAG: hypothetical protein V3V16_04450 [Melioribacteraceae bacterium]